MLKVQTRFCAGPELFTQKTLKSGGLERAVPANLSKIVLKTFISQWQVSACLPSNYHSSKVKAIKPTVNCFYTFCNIFMNITLHVHLNIIVNKLAPLYFMQLFLVVVVGGGPDISSL